MLSKKNVAVSWYSFHNNGISFQVLKVYPEVRFVFAGFDEALLATSKFWIFGYLRILDFSVEYTTLPEP
jgi:hypothetical protein